MNITWIEIPVTDIDRAAAFYGALFGQALSPMDYDGRRFAVIETPDGHPGMSINQVAGFAPGPDGPLIYLNVGDALDTLLSRVADAGGRVVIPRSAMSPTVDYATFRDSEGNTLALSTGS